MYERAFGAFFYKEGDSLARLFGTDGVRGVANRDLTCELAFKLGQAATQALASKVHKPSILVGRDTRISGEMLEAAMVSGICSMGGRALTIGVLPTPAIAYLTRIHKADAGCVISASHNTVEYNGIKFFDANGYKLPDQTEDRIEAMTTSHEPLKMPLGIDVGRIVRMKNAFEDYVNYLVSCAPERLDGLKLVVDCANGAAHHCAPEALRRLGAQVFSYYHLPDGTNINEHCGSTHPARMQELVSELGADAGLAFDGDADRLIMADERGSLVDGDQCMAILGIDMLKRGVLKDSVVVGTIMSNMGLEIALKKHHCTLNKTKVGDRYVLEHMRANGYTLGGEQSGHIIFREYSTTGDGTLSAIQMLCVMKRTGQKLSALAAVMTKLPQVLVNAQVSQSGMTMWQDDPDIVAIIAAVEAKLSGTGRVMIRPSGTEPLVRVMIEGEDQTVIENDAYEIAALLEQKYPQGGARRDL